MSKQTGPKLGEKWYIFDDADGECTVVQINDITNKTVVLEFDGGIVKRYHQEYVSFVEKVQEVTLN